MSVGGEYSDTAVVVRVVTWWQCAMYTTPHWRDRSAAAWNTNSINILVTQWYRLYLSLDTWCDVISIHPNSATKQLYTERISTKHLAVFNVKLSPGRAITINMIGGVPPPPPPPPLALAHGFTFLLAAVSNSDYTFSPFRINMSLRIKVIFHAKLVS